MRLWEILRGPHQTLFEVGRSRALREEGAFSYRNGHVAEVGGAVAGGLVGYRIADDPDPRYRVAGAGDAVELPPFVQALIELEALVPGYWYVNILATYPESRGQGIAAALLAHADELGRAAGPNGTALIVASGNEAARRLYDRSGYRETARRPAVGGPGGGHGGDWLLLTKPHG